MTPATRKFLKVFLSLLFGAYSLPMLGYGGYLFVCWVRIHTTDVYYADYHYAIAALAWIGIGLVSLWASLYAAWRRSFYGLLFAVPLFLGLAVLVNIPNLLPRSFSGMADSNYLSGVHFSFRVWYQANRRFPASESEFRDALWKGRAAWQDAVGPASESGYKQHGKVFPYQIVVINNASGPRLTDISHRPGVIYYCVSSDLQQFWITMTVLESDLELKASLGQIGGASPEEFVIHRAGADYPSSQN